MKKRSIADRIRDAVVYSLLLLSGGALLASAVLAVVNYGWDGLTIAQKAVVAASGILGSLAVTWGGLALRPRDGHEGGEKPPG